jgi:hypothetical protein
MGPESGVKYRSHRCATAIGAQIGLFPGQISAKSIPDWKSRRSSPARIDDIDI